MGVVYLAEDTKLGRKVALKFLPAHFSSDTRLRSRLESEARSAAALNEANIATIYSIDEHDDEMFIVMEYVDGRNLRERIGGTPLPADDVLDIAKQVATGLAAAHNRGIVHRDIKSANVLIDASGRAKITDFGLARFSEDTRVTQDGAAVGTIAYMSPEQIQGREADRRSDLWSLGVVLYEMLTGRLPFYGDNDAALIYEILNSTPASVTRHRSDVPVTLSAALSQLLQKDPERRCPSADELLRILEGDQFAEAPAKKKSVAVLYFENMSPDKENEYFCAGITEDLIIDLSRIDGLSVIPRSDVLPFRNKEINRQDLGRQLGVAYVLEGSVRKAANKIRITAQLIDVASGFPVWGERYDRLFEDVFEIQEDVSRRITDAMKVSLSEAESEAIARKPTEDMRAYDLYMRGRDFLVRGGQANNASALQMLEHALEIDPTFALAMVALAEACAYQYTFYDGSSEWLDKCVDLSEKAITVDPTLAEARFGMAIARYHQKQFPESLRILEDLVRKKPDFYPVYRWLGLASIASENFDDAITYGEHAARLKPNSEEPWVVILTAAYRKGDREQGDAARRELVRRAEHSLELNPDDALVMSRLAANAAALGMRDRAIEIVDRLLEMDPDDGLVLYNCACACANLDDRDRALAYLRIAIKKGYMNINEWVRDDPDFESLRQDPEFRQLLEDFPRN